MTQNQENIGKYKRYTIILGEKMDFLLILNFTIYI